MNKGQRGLLQEVVNRLGTLIDEDQLADMSPADVKVIIETSESVATTVAEEERDKFENMNEGLQGSPTGQAIEDAANALENISWPDPDFDFRNEDQCRGFIEEVQMVIDEIEGLL
jgi:hypothetical protein